MKEKDFHKQFIQYLEYKGIVRIDTYDFMVHKGWYFAILQESRDRTHNLFKKSLGLVAGVSDLVIFHKGNIGFYELKVKPNRQTKSQKIFAKKIEDSGYLYRLIYSIEDFEEFL